MAYMLIDENNSNVFPRLGVAVKRFLDGLVLRLVVDYEEVLLRVGAACDVLLFACGVSIQPHVDPRVDRAWH